jgi:hypothetical protein
MRRNDPRKIITAFPGTMPANRARPAPAPAPLVRVHRITQSGVQLHVETARDPLPKVTTRQERIDALGIRTVPQCMGWPTRSKATLA